MRLPVAENQFDAFQHAIEAEDLALQAAQAGESW